MSKYHTILEIIEVTDSIQHGKEKDLLRRLNNYIKRHKGQS